MKEDFYQTLLLIPKGKVVTYGFLGKLTGKHPRQVGQLLHKNPDSSLYPCHRVVNHLGKLAPSYAFGGEFVQFEKLKSEGVFFRNGKVDLRKSHWQPKRKPVLN